MIADVNTDPAFDKEYAKPYLSVFSSWFGQVCIHINCGYMLFLSSIIAD